MKDKFLFEELKTSYLKLFSEQSNAKVDLDGLSVNYGKDIDVSYIEYLQRLFDSQKLLDSAISTGDRLAVQAALLRIRVHSMTLSSFFEAFTNDADELLNIVDEPKIPEDYKIPDHYNYPQNK
ncbi:hypothetical protein [Photorhabdus antumapuensis]|uniref:hypothetical protein n=1 Tax=Photorhabdus antumapuensis TaxID=2862867 RepID=UPI001CEC170A|nr:hypothetical protein [Photorhabdus antumapuensis]MCA6221228.1 hypothetical protein [Photorhabdus antumapuensis]